MVVLLNELILHSQPNNLQGIDIEIGDDSTVSIQLNGSKDSHIPGT